MAVVREDVVKLGFDIDMGELSKMSQELDDIKRMLTSGMGDDTFDELIKESKKAGEGIEDIKDDLKGIKPDGVDDVAKGLKDTDKKAKGAHSELKKIASTGFDKAVNGLKKMGSALGSVAIQAGKVLAKGLALGAAGVAAVVGKSIANYADYEQLVGGVDTLFKSDSNTVQKYADNAYKTAGLSANEYMETVTSFSASLINSLGGDTAKAADFANMAITDMADNANKMGTDMSSIQDAYQGFAKQNYTMLDNLKLGYGGTQSEMKRLLKDAEKIQKAQGKNVKYSLNNFDDIVEAIHVVQENMGIAGTTSKEASETISGSFASMKSAWDNTLTSLVVGGDSFDRCVDNLVDSAKTFGKNIMPAMTKALSGIGKLIEELAPVVEKELPGIIDSLLPPLIKAATSLIKGLIIALPDVISTLAQELPAVLAQVWDAMSEAFGDLPGMDKVEMFFGNLIDFFERNTGVIKKIIIGVLALIAVFKLFSKIKGITGLFGGKGGKGESGGGIFGVFSNLAKMNPKTALTGMLNIAIILGGFMILAAVMMAAAPYLAKLSDMQSIAEVLVVTAAVGLIGTYMAQLASKVGNIPIATVATGLANIAIALVGFGALAAVLMWLAPYMAQLSNMQTTMEILIIIGVVGVVGTALAALAGLVGNIPVAVVLTGLANITLALAGFGALAAVLMWLAPYMAQLSNMQTMVELLTIIGVVGLVGSALALLAGLIGAIPITAVLTGLANIALALGGFSAVVVAFGALSQIEGFSTFLTSGGETLTTICNILGQMVGAVIGGIGEGITASLPTIGTNLSNFATNIKPMFDTFSTVDSTGLSDFALALAGLIAVIAGEKIVSVVTGGIDYATLGTNLSTMATNLSGFFSTIMTFPEGGFERAKTLFNCLAGISSLPKEGGVVGWFQGEVDYSKMATGLTQLAGAMSFFTAVQAIPEAAFTAATNLFNCLSGVSSLPKDGGITQWFTGTTDFAGVASGLQTLSSESMIAALTAISGIPATAYTALTSLFNALAGVQAMPSEGGIFGWFTGDKSTGLTNVASELPGVATNIATFFTNIGGRTDFTPITNLFNALSNIELNTDVADKGFWSGVSEMGSMGTALGDFATNAASFFTMINSLNTANLDSFFTSLATVGNLPATITTIDSQIGTALGNVATTVETKMYTIRSTFVVTLGGVNLTLMGYATTFYQRGVDIMTGLNDGMLSCKETLVATANEIATAIGNEIDNVMAIASPSRVTRRSGEFIGDGLALGMESKVQTVKLAATDLGLASMPFTGKYSPETSGNTTTTYNNGGDSEQTTISPQFNLTISGSQDDRALARKVKQWVAESIQETFESMERKLAY